MYLQNIAGLWRKRGESQGKALSRRKVGTGYVASERKDRRGKLKNSGLRLYNVKRKKGRPAEKYFTKGRGLHLNFASPKAFRRKAQKT